MPKYILDKLTYLRVKLQIINSTRKNIGMYSIKCCAAGLLRKKKERRNKAIYKLKIFAG